MKTQEMGDAIAQACGWTRDNNPDCDCLYRTADGRAMFNPASCLNAMHEAEKVLTAFQENIYISRLADIIIASGERNIGGFDYLHATAAQRAEAFLRTIGKWEEDK